MRYNKYPMFYWKSLILFQEAKPKEGKVQWVCLKNELIDTPLRGKLIF